MSIEFKLPELGENIASGDVVNVLVHEGDQSPPTRASASWKPKRRWSKSPARTAASRQAPRPEGRHRQGRPSPDHARSGRTAAAAERTPEPAAAAAECRGNAAVPRAQPPGGKPASPPAARPRPRPDYGGTPAGPAVRRLARELGVDLAASTAADRAAASRRRMFRRPAPPPQRSLPPAAVAGRRRLRRLPPGEPGQDAWGPVRREQMPRIRRTIAEQMAEVGQHHPSRDQLRRRRRHRPGTAPRRRPRRLPGRDIRLTPMPFVMKAVAVASARHPTVNASLDDEKAGDRLQAIREPGRGRRYAAGAGRAGGAERRSA